MQHHFRPVFLRRKHAKNRVRCSEIGNGTPKKEWMSAIIKSHYEVNSPGTLLLSWSGNTKANDVAAAAGSWTKVGANNFSMILEQVQTGGDIEINSVSNREIAEVTKLCDCMAAIYINAHTNTSVGSIKLNTERINKREIPRETIAHEIGHVIFGGGHPSMPDQNGYRGVMDYKGRININDWFWLHSIYGPKKEAKDER